MGEIMRGEATPAQIGGFLVALRAKGETADEIAGCAEAMREHVLAVRPERDDLVDTAGHRRRRRAHAQHLDRRGARRGGRRRRRREARQPRRLVGARARPTCSRRSASSSSCEPERIARVDRRARLRLPLRAGAPPGDAARGAGAARARDAHGLQRARPADEPGRRARAGRRRLLAPSSCRTIAEVLAQLGARRAFVVHGAGGSTSSPRPARTSSARSSTARCASARSTRSSSAFRAARPRSCAAARPTRTRRAIREVFAGADGGARDAILLNAAGAIAAGGHAERPARGLELAREAVDSGAAARAARARWSRSRGSRSRPDGTLPRRARGAGPRRDRRGQAALAVGRRPAARRRSRPARGASSSAPAPRPSRSSSTSASAARSTTCAPPARRRALPLLAKGFFSTRADLLDELHGRGRRRRAAAAARPRRRAARPRCWRARAELGLDTLVEAHDADELDARSRARRRPDRRQRARPVDVRDRPRARSSSSSRARRATACRRRERRPLARAGARPPSSRAPTRCSSARR